jgi:hypothetical protein
VSNSSCRRAFAGDRDRTRTAACQPFSGISSEKPKAQAEDRKLSGAPAQACIRIAPLPTRRQPLMTADEHQDPDPFPSAPTPSRLTPWSLTEDPSPVVLSPAASLT